MKIILKSISSENSQGWEILESGRSITSKIFPLGFPLRSADPGDVGTIGNANSQ